MTSHIKDIKAGDIFLAGISITCGLSYALNTLASTAMPAEDLRLVIIPAVVSCIFLSLILLFSARTALRIHIGKRYEGISPLETFKKYDSYTFTPFAFLIIGAFGVSMAKTICYIIAPLFLLSMLAMISVITDRKKMSKFFLSRNWLAFIFFISGMAALIYQIVWQRTLFATFGTNMESATVIVSIFMFGLGIGALAGGILSKRHDSGLPYIFFVCEIMAGIFGLFSLPLIKGVSVIAIEGSLLEISLATYALLSVPTALMGATLPVLVAYLDRHTLNIGASVGLLYASNTAGAAVACFITVDLLFRFTGQHGAVISAALLNLIAGVLVLAYVKGKETAE